MFNPTINEIVNNGLMGNVVAVTVENKYTVVWFENGVRLKLK